MIDWFYSDPHFGHANIIQYCDRPFTSVEDMDDELISRYNNVVRRDDVVCFTGDVAFRKRKDYLNQLNGRKVLVRGNHDGSAADCTLDFEFVTDELMLNLGGRTVRVNHYPPKGASQPPSPTGWWLVHGHTHEKGRGEGRRIHVGVDAWGLAPVHVQQVAELMDERVRSNAK